MNTVRDVVKDCKLAYHDVKHNLGKLNDVIEKLYGIQVMLPHLLLTVQHTYTYDILAINIRFQGTHSLTDSEHLAKLLAQNFTLIQPPQLNVVETCWTKVAKDIDMLVKFETKYQCLLFMMMLYKFPNCEDESNIL
jgi:hypothetical protein